MLMDMCYMADNSHLKDKYHTRFTEKILCFAMEECTVQML
jgi:hypothetical protein